jgi:hypothetical protein
MVSVFVWAGSDFKKLVRKLCRQLGKIRQNSGNEESGALGDKTYKDVLDKKEKLQMT